MVLSSSLCREVPPLGGMSVIGVPGDQAESTAIALHHGPGSKRGLAIVTDVPVCRHITWQDTFVYLKRDPVIVFVSLTRTGSAEPPLAVWMSCQLWAGRWGRLGHNRFSG